MTDIHTYRSPSLRAQRSSVGVSALLLASSTILLSGCATEADTPARGSADSAVAFAEQFYYDVLSGKEGVCDVFTDAGRADFVADMTPAADCTEAADVLGDSIGPDNVDSFTADNTYTLDSTTDTTVVVRADFVAYADLMTLEWVDGEWRVGPTRRIPGSDDVNPPVEDELPDAGDHDHAHQH